VPVPSALDDVETVLIGSTQALPCIYWTSYSIFKHFRALPSGIKFINILQAHFAHFAPIFLRQKITNPDKTREKLLNLLVCKKCEHKMLMKF